MLRDVLFTIQYITISVLFIEILIVFLGWKNSIHSNLLLTCLASFVSNMGYLFEMQAASEEAFMVALKFSYLGRVMIGFAFFLFAAKMCRIKIPKGIISALVLLHVGIYVSVMTFEHHDLYYKTYQFIADPILPRFYHTNGTVHDLFIALNFILSPRCRDREYSKGRPSDRKATCATSSNGILSSIPSSFCSTAVGITARTVR